MSLFGKAQNKDENSYREKLCDMYLNMYKGNTKEMLHKLAFKIAMDMTDKGENIPGDDYKIYNSIYGKKFSPNQVSYIENNIVYPQYGNMSAKELAYIMADSTIQDENDTNRKCKESVAKLYDKGFFKTYLNGMVKDLALWDMGKLDDVTDFIGWLYSKNPFTKKLNRQVILDSMKSTMDEIADTNEGFMGDDVFMAFNELTRALSKLNRKGG